jgi:aminoglycoside phosphotransferase (APT) family kinase protein
VNEVPSGQPLARGRTADVYAWEVGYVLKRFHEWFDLESIQNEARVARAVHASGLPVPLTGEILHVDGSHALVYERVDGPDMFDGLRRQPWRVFNFARRFAALHAQIHIRLCQPGFSAQRERLGSKIRQAAPLAPHIRSVLLDALSSMPSGDRICHGDFHPGNVLLADDGEVIIDWMDATCGNPLADVARSTVIALGAAASEQIPNPFSKALVRLFHSLYIRRYFQLSPGDIKEYRRWLPIAAAARLSEGILEVEPWLVKQAQEIQG